MAEKKIQLKIITPSDIKLDEQVDMVIIRAIDGEIGFLPDHEECSIVLDYGMLRIIDSGKERKIAVFGGFAEIKDNVLSVMTSDAEWPEDIDAALAKEHREHLEQRLKEHTDALEIEHDQVLLRRALVRIDVSSYTILHPQGLD